MEAIRKKLAISDKDRNITLSIPKNFGSKIEVIILPEVQAEDESSCFEIVGSDGTEYKMPDWTDEEFNKIGYMSCFEDDDTSSEDVFDV